MNTKVFKIDPDNLYLFENEIKIAADFIKRGELVVMPTETVYGLGGDATNPSAAEKIYKAKGRPSDNPLIIHIFEPCDAERFTYTNETYYKLAERFMPGPLTVVLPAKETVPMKTRSRYRCGQMPRKSYCETFDKRSGSTYCRSFRKPFRLAVSHYCKTRYR